MPLENLRARRSTRTMMPRADPSRQSQAWRCVGLALAVLAGLAMQAGVSPVEAAKKRLTCSFIKKQCIKECSKQVDASFCKSYCDDRRQECLQTGRWDGIERQFKNVRKR